MEHDPADGEGINHGIASDRLLVDWDLVSPVVGARGGGDRVGQRQGTLLPVELPADLDALLSDDMAQAKLVRDALGMGCRMSLQRAIALSALKRVAVSM